MSNALDAVRSLSDDGITRFALLTTRWEDRARSGRRLQAIATLLDERMLPGEYLGRLMDGRLGVLVCQAFEADAGELEQRADWYRECLSEAGGVDTQVYEFPLRPLERQFSPEDKPLYPEGGIEAYFVKPTPIWKRVMDLSLALTALLVLWPLLLVVALLIRITSPGPVFFRQTRTGLGGRRFVMLKFRSMVDGADRLQDELRHLNEQDGPAFKIRQDPRITAVGYWLRRTCVDELPQLWSVIRGEMSIVGPRPLPCHESAACEGWQRRRLEVAPGLSCLWQVRGRSLVSFDHWMRLDLEYIRRRSLWLDLNIIGATIPALAPWRRTPDVQAGDDGIEDYPREGVADANGLASIVPTNHAAGVPE